MTAASPIDTMPLYVRAGSILPMGPFLQYVAEKPADPIELRVYPGANGSMSLYEDDGLTYDYEHGKYATIPITWNDKTHTLTIGKRQGSFAGMLSQRTFHIIWVRDGVGTGVDIANADRTVNYSERRSRCMCRGCDFSQYSKTDLTN